MTVLRFPNERRFRKGEPVVFTCQMGQRIHGHVLESEGYSVKVRPNGKRGYWRVHPEDLERPEPASGPGDVLPLRRTEVP